MHIFQRALPILGSLLLAPATHAFELSDGQTDCRLLPATRTGHDVVARFANWKAAAKAADVAYANDDDARNALCTNRDICVLGDGMVNDLYVTDRKSVYLIREMAYHGTEGGQSVRSAEFVAPGVLMIVVDEYSIDRGDPEIDEPSEQIDWRNIGLLDVKSGRWLARIVHAHDADTVAFEKGFVHGTACGASFRHKGGVPATAAAPTSANADAEVQRGRKLTAAKNYKAARMAFEAAIAVDAKHARAWSGLGYAALLDGSPEAVSAAFEQALTLDADPKFQAAVWFNLGLLAEQQKDLSAARTAFSKSMELHPSEAVRKKLDGLKMP
jgi:tetratricopeptide (TPR) repeat protein